VQCYANAVYAIIMWSSVRLSQVGVLPRQLNLGSRKQCHTIAKGLFWRQKSWRNSDGVTPNAKERWGR